MLTERLFASKLGVQPVYFRPPYSIDQEPDTNDQAAPIEHIQHLGYVIVGNKIDTNDWDEHPRKSPRRSSTPSSSRSTKSARPRAWMRGSIILMHDGGGDRSATVAALPKSSSPGAARPRLRPSSPSPQLIGKTRAEVMPPLTSRQRWHFAQIDSIAFFFISLLQSPRRLRLLHRRRPYERLA